MIVCKNCGHQNDDNDTFCGSCGKFLEWTGERVAVPQPEPEPLPPPPAPAPEPAHVGLIDRVKHAVGIEETAASTTPLASVPEPASPQPPVAPLAAAVPAPVAWSPPAAPPLRPVPVSSPLPAPPFPPPSASTVTEPAGTREPVLAGVGAPPASAGTAAPTRDDEPMSRRPISVAPAAARPRPAARTMEAPTRRRPGDLICGQCGEGNDPTRHFCRRCGHTLDEAIAVQLPWYRRLFNRLFGPRTYEAGYRHRRVGPPNVMGAFWRIVRLAVVGIIAVAILAFLLVPNFHSLVVNRVTSAVTSVRKLVHPNLDPVIPTGISASTSIAGHLPGLAIDGYNNTYWAALPNDRAPFLTVRFAKPTDLADIGITSGASGTAPTDQYRAQPRPLQIHLVFSDNSTKDITLADKATAQFFPLNVTQVTSVEIHITSTFATAGPAPSSVAITEIEFRISD